MDIEIKNSHIKQLQRDDLQNCFSFWDFKDNLEKRRRIEFEIVNKRRMMYVYILKDKYVAGMSLYPLGDNTIYLSYLAVQEDARNQGIGTKMINYACEVSKRNGYSNIALKVDKDNLGAERLYERLGFSATGTDDYGRNEMRAVL